MGYEYDISVKDYGWGMIKLYTLKIMNDDNYMYERKKENWNAWRCVVSHSDKTCVVGVMSQGHRQSNVDRCMLDVGKLTVSADRR